MDFIMGQITLFAGNFIPVGFAACDGALLPIAQNTALFSILGVNYGGDGVTNFALPKIADLDDAKYMIATQGIYPQRP